VASIVSVTVFSRPRFGATASASYTKGKDMTREELVDQAALLACLIPTGGTRHGTTLVPVHLIDAAVAVAKAFLKLARPEWKDAPDGQGLYWIDCYGYCTLTTVAQDGVWTHGLKQAVDSFKGAKWAKAELPVGPNREANG
jgi:hypothetical protein